MIRALIFLVIIGVVLGASYFSANYILKPTAKIIEKEFNQTISPLDYTITTISGDDITRIIILFDNESDINTSCVDSVKIDNVSVPFNVSRIADREIEVDIYKRLTGTHRFILKACKKEINDILIIR